MANLNQIANWDSFQNPLKRVCGRNSICPVLVARGQEDDNAQMLFYSPDLEDTTNLMEMFRTKGNADE